MATHVIYHNPSCSKSRKTLAYLEASGLTFEVVPYLDQPLDKTELENLLQLLEKTPADLIRLEKEVIKTLSDQEILAMLVADPRLLNRPIVVTPDGARLCRPPETVFEILPKEAVERIRLQVWSSQEKSCKC